MQQPRHTFRQVLRVARRNRVILPLQHRSGEGQDGVGFERHREGGHFVQQDAWEIKKSQGDRMRISPREKKKKQDCDHTTNDFVVDLCLRSRFNTNTICAFYEASTSTHQATTCPSSHCRACSPPARGTGTAACRRRCCGGEIIICSKWERKRAGGKQLKTIE